MLIIRKEQMDALSHALLEVFENEMLSYVKEHFAEQCSLLEDAQIRQVVATGIARAKAHGFETRGDITDFITLMFTFGSYFDEDPQLPWAAEILEDKEGFGPSAMIADLYAEAAGYLEQVSGDNGEYYKRALVKARDSFQSLLKNAISDPTQGVKSLLRGLYPEKYQTLTDTDLDRFIDQAKASCDRYGVGPGEGFQVYAFLMFILGSHFDRDPLHPWAADILQGNLLTDPHLKARKLYEAARARLDLQLAETVRSERT